MKFLNVFSKWAEVLLKNPFRNALYFITLCWLGLGSLVYYIEQSSTDQNIKTLGDGIWWGIVTILTVGYGDRFPVTMAGRIVAGFLMIAGVVSIALVTAKISSYFLERTLLERRGIVNTQELSQHFVICGWKKEMASILFHILDFNKGLDAAQLVLINNAPDSEIENLLETPRLEKIKVLRGDFYIETNLKRVAPERAQKILILADATPDSSGKVPTLVEADAKTIMTAMILSNIARGIPIVAEILDASMDQYLKLANVQEIVYSREYSRMLLALSSAGVGLTNIFHDLLDPHSGHYLKTIEIPEHLKLRTYKDLNEHYAKTSQKTHLVGVLENSGNIHKAKESAIHKAQQTPNVEDLVHNLLKVKHMKYNMPKFNPGNEYIIQDGTMAIVIEEVGSHG